MGILKTEMDACLPSFGGVFLNPYVRVGKPLSNPAIFRWELFPASTCADIIPLFGYDLRVK
jgi:hypothetical protein